MKILAVITNIIQIGIILFIFFTKGLDLGGLVILLLFILIIFPFINFLVLLTVFRHGTEGDLAESRHNEVLIKREVLRVAYNSDKKPVLLINKDSYDILDISETGIRFLNKQNSKFKKKIKGVITLFCGVTMDISGIIVRRHENQIAVFLKNPIKQEIILKEKLY